MEEARPGLLANQVLVVETPWVDGADLGSWLIRFLVEEPLKGKLFGLLWHLGLGQERLRPTLEE